jgi:DNA-binding SARP family transcriptional activator
VVLAATAASLADPSHAERHRSAAAAAAAETGLPLPAADSRAIELAHDGGSREEAEGVGFEVRCFGPLEAWLDGQPLDLAPIKPRVRSLLRVLALHAGRPVHKDRLIDWLWPGEGDVRVGTRNLQVAVSSLRQLLEPGVARGAATIVVRDGDSYRLRLSPGAIDLVGFEEQVALGRRARSDGDPAGAIDALGLALERYRGELLADEGAAEWVTAERDRFRLAAADASQARAELLLEEGRAAEAATEADRGLRIDQYRDALWRLLVAANEAAGDLAAAARSQERYDAVLRDLGV